MREDFIKELTDIVGEDSVRYDEPMKYHTTFRIGGPADVFVTPADAVRLQEALCCCRDYGVSYMVIGNGSNLLVGDRGIRGVVFRVSQTMNRVLFEDEPDGSVKIYAGAGTLLSRLSSIAADKGLKGLAFACGIPGSFGGAIAMNAGAYGGDMQSVVENAAVLLPDGDIKLLQADEMGFGYRTSVIQKENLIVLGASVRLQRGHSQEILDEMEELSKRRREKQPLEFPSAGSVFKRPQGYFAGKLIEDAGLKGFSVGDAQVSEKHCGFVINTGDATAEDVLLLIRHIQKVVADRFGVKLETEIKIVGEF